MVGGGFGYGMWNADTSATDTNLDFTTATVTNGGRGWLGTLRGGFDYQFSEHIVAGVLGDYDFANITGTLATPTAINFFNILGGTEKEISPGLWEAASVG